MGILSALAGHQNTNGHQSGTKALTAAGVTRAAKAAKRGGSAIKATK